MSNSHNAVTIALTDDKEGPKVRLNRNFRERALEMQFDENPGREITDQLKAEGWRWESRARYGDHKGAWIMRLEQGYEVRAEADARRLLKDVANQIRANNGLEEATVMGVMDR